MCIRFVACSGFPSSPSDANPWINLLPLFQVSLWRRKKDSRGISSLSLSRFLLRPRLDHDLWARRNHSALQGHSRCLSRLFFTRWQAKKWHCPEIAKPYFHNQVTEHCETAHLPSEAMMSTTETIFFNILTVVCPRCPGDGKAHEGGCIVIDNLEL